MDLSLVIPVWNDLSGLDRLLQQVAEIGCFSQVIIVDDASDEPVGPDNLPAAAVLADRLVWLRSDSQRGAGYARNMALDHVSGDYVIFFDSDDLFTEDFTHILSQASEAEQFDFLIFRHHDSRMLVTGGGMLDGDACRWAKLGLGDALIQITLDQAQGLIQIAAYPWNKIYRTDFLRDHAIRCTETMVHNDVELHWSSFIMAERILASSRTGAVHFVDDSGNRLTNRRSPDRLEVFQAFSAVMRRITASRNVDQLSFLVPFMRFSSDLVDWIDQNLDDGYRVQLRQRERSYYLAALDPLLMTLIAHRDLSLACKINRSITREQLQ